MFTKFRMMEAAGTARGKAAPILGAALSASLFNTFKILFKLQLCLVHNLLDSGVFRLLVELFQRGLHVVHKTEIQQRYVLGVDALEVRQLVGYVGIVEEKAAVGPSTAISFHLPAISS